MRYGARWTEDDYRRELRRIRAARPLHQLQADALQGRHPVTGRWWPAWRPWYPTGGSIAQILSRFTSITGRRAGSKRTPAKAIAARQNARQPRPRARLANRDPQVPNRSVSSPASRLRAQERPR